MKLFNCFLFILGNISGDNSIEHKIVVGECAKNDLSSNITLDLSNKGMQPSSLSDADVIETTTKTSKMNINERVDNVKDDKIECSGTAMTSNGVVHVHQLYDKPLTQFDPELEIHIKVIIL